MASVPAGSLPATDPQAATAAIRNLALVGPAGASKTSLAEALVHRVGAITTPGTLERGSTVSDHDPLERQPAAPGKRWHACAPAGYAGRAGLHGPEPARAGSGGDRRRGYQRRRGRGAHGRAREGLRRQQRAGPPHHRQPHRRRAHRALVEQVVEVDPAFVDRYLNDGDVDASELHAPLEQALREGHLIPVCFVSAKTGAGVPTWTRSATCWPMCSR